MTRSQFLRNLFWRVKGRVHGSKESPLSLFERRGQLRQSDAADDHEIDVARRHLLVACERAINKGNVNAASKGIETLHEDVSEPGRPPNTTLSHKLRPEL